MLIRVCLIGLAFLVISAAFAVADDFPEAFNTQQESEPLLSPAQALAAIELPEGFQATLFAAEPDVRQPIAMTIDAGGRLWVVENYTYAESKTNYETERQGDRVLIFEDTDGDGRFDDRKVFWDQGKKVTGIEVGFGGVWLTAAPELLFIPDRDGDDVPDGDPEVVLNGWNDGRIRHNIVNGLRWGPDGWLYGRHGIQAMSLVGTPETPPEHREQLECAIWRYHPTRRIFEVVARGTTNPWGMDWDQHGQLFFINTVIGHLWHVVPGSYYQRMYGQHFDPHVYQLLPQTADHYHWDIDEENWHDTKKIGVTSGTDAAGGGHAHQGMMIYNGDNWPAEYRGKLFTFNFHGRRMNMDHLHRHGATYVGKHGDDFMKSADVWFRGIEMVYGPDGGVIVADWSDIGECHENDGIHRTSGRLFKITHGDVDHQAVNLAAESSIELVDRLAHGNVWFARQARRLLQERAWDGQDMTEAARKLRQWYADSAEIPHKLRAMWTLYAIEKAGEPWLIQQLQHENEHVRVWAVQLLIDQGAPSETARQAFEQLAESETSGLVLSFLTSALRRIPYEQRWVLATRLASHIELSDDSHYPLLVWYGIESAVAAYSSEAVELALRSQLPVVRKHIARRLTEEIDRQPDAIAALVNFMAESNETVISRDLLRGMKEATQGWSKATAPARWEIVEKRFGSHQDQEMRDLANSLSLVFGSGRALDELRRLVTDGSQPLDVRTRAIESLVASRADDFAPTLQKLLGTRYINVAAIRGLAAYDDSDTPKVLIDKYSSLHRPAQQEAISTLVSRVSYAKVLLAAISANQIDRQEVSAFQIRQMQLLGDAGIDQQIQTLWPELRSIGEKKQKQIAGYREKLTAEVMQSADLSHGRSLFKQQCAKCHKLFDDGELVGPVLTGAQRNNLSYLLENIVDPSATVSKDYQLTIVLTDDGRVFNGVLLDQNERTITLRTTTERIIIARDEILQLRDSELSMMPDSQLDVMSINQVRDLLAYLMSPRQVPLP